MLAGVGSTWTTSPVSERSWNGSWGRCAMPRALATHAITATAAPQPYRFSVCLIQPPWGLERSSEHYTPARPFFTSSGGCRPGKELPFHQFEVERDLDVVAHQDAAGFERLVPRQAEVAAL